LQNRHPADIDQKNQPTSDQTSDHGVDPYAVDSPIRQSETVGDKFERFTAKTESFPPAGKSIQDSFSLTTMAISDWMKHDD
jgi:hypothetical protein